MRFPVPMLELCLEKEPLITVVNGSLIGDADLQQVLDLGVGRVEISRDRVDHLERQRIGLHRRGEAPELLDDALPFPLVKLLDW